VSAMHCTIAKSGGKCYRSSFMWMNLSAARGNHKNCWHGYTTIGMIA
jgi:hypothetical protein